MREIKFRAWEKPMSKEWCEERQISFVPDFKGQMLTLPLNNYFGLSRFFGFLDDEQHVLMQFTGLHDKNGKEIYEGDILPYHHSLSKKNTTHVVRFGEHEAQGGDYYSNLANGWYIYGGGSEDDTGALNENLCGIDNYLEVIGNIYENPELLEDK